MIYTHAHTHTHTHHARTHRKKERSDLLHMWTQKRSVRKRARTRAKADKEDVVPALGRRKAGDNIRADGEAEVSDDGKGEERKENKKSKKRTSGKDDKVDDNEADEGEDEEGEEEGDGEEDNIIVLGEDGDATAGAPRAKRRRNTPAASTSDPKALNGRRRFLISVLISSAYCLA